MADEQSTATTDFEEKLDRALKMLDPKFDWEAYYDEIEDDSEKPPDIFRACVKLVPHDEKWPRPLCEVGGTPVDDAASALYRVIYLMKPPKLDFSDMYKEGILDIVSPCGNYVVGVEFWKYELCLRFFAPKETIPPKVVYGNFDITSGAPGSDNGWKTTDPIAIKFFQLVTLAVNRSWMMYSGNNFEV